MDSFDVTVSLFFIFHLKIVLSTSNTIETIDKKAIKPKEFLEVIKINLYSSIQTKNSINKTTFDRGAKGNWAQVFGSNPSLWPFKSSALQESR